MRTAKAALMGGSVLAALLLAVGLNTLTTTPVSAQAGTQGQWRTLTTQVPINPVHVALLRTGQVLIVSGSGNVATETNFRAAVWDPAAETFQVRSLGWDMFCNGMVTLHDGRVLINGGNLKYDPFWGEPRNAVFDPMTGLFTDVENMLHGRWYPTVTTLGDGRVMTFSGLLETGGTNTAVEMYTVGSGWSQEFPAGWTPPLYPRMHLSTDGRVFYSGSGRTSRFFNPSTGLWTTSATTQHGSSRSYGTSVMLPLTPANSYRPRVMILGGGNPGTATTEIIDLAAATPTWAFGPSMSQPRIQLNATLLPNGKVLATGGSRDDESAVTASLNADLYDPVANSFSPAGANVFPRLYHSNALLMPDATVLLIGGNPQRGNYEGRLEIYSPAYLFNGDGSTAVRPTITGADTGHRRVRLAIPGPDPECREHRVRRAGPSRDAHACVRHGSTARRAVVYRGQRPLERHGAAQWQHRAARLLHAVRAEHRGGAVGREIREDWCLSSESGPGCHHHEPGEQRHRRPWRIGVVCGKRHGFGRHYQCV